MPFGVIPRPDARCPICGSLERQRLIHLFMTRKTDLFDGRSRAVLHVAPEPPLARLFQRMEAVHYVSADLSAPDAMVKLDITEMPFRDDTFHVIYCSHVLEHVPDDRKAMREFRRVLRSDGWAVLQVPLTDEPTYEDPQVTSPAERERLFGQHDHVRRYGPDYRDRLIEAGFSVTVCDLAAELSDSDVRRYGLARNEKVFFCRKADG
jgi:SAM-dependent methyltransferase